MTRNEELEETHAEVKLKLLLWDAQKYWEEANGEWMEVSLTLTTDVPSFHCDKITHFPKNIPLLQYNYFMFQKAPMKHTKVVHIMSGVHNNDRAYVHYYAYSRLLRTFKSFSISVHTLPVNIKSTRRC